MNRFTGVSSDGDSTLTRRLLMTFSGYAPKTSSYDNSVSGISFHRPRSTFPFRMFRC